MPSDPNAIIAGLQKFLAFILSWIVLTTVAIIISGKLMARRMPLGFLPDDMMKIDMWLFKLTSRGDEVSLGFIVFISSLGAWVFFGGKPSYEIFRLQAGIDIGQWNSLCVISAFCSILFSFVFFILCGLFSGSPIISVKSRKDMLDKLKDSSGVRNGD